MKYEDHKRSIPFEQVAQLLNQMNVAVWRAHLKSALLPSSSVSCSGKCAEDHGRPQSCSQSLTDSATLGDLLNLNFLIPQMMILNLMVSQFCGILEIVRFEIVI